MARKLCANWQTLKFRFSRETTECSLMFAVELPGTFSLPMMNLAIYYNVALGKLWSNHMTIERWSGKSGLKSNILKCRTIRIYILKYEVQLVSFGSWWRVTLLFANGKAKDQCQWFARWKWILHRFNLFTGEWAPHSQSTFNVIAT